MKRIQWRKSSVVRQGLVLTGLLTIALAIQAQEIGLDLSIATSRLSAGGGFAVHGQLLYDNNLGYDIGYEYQDRLSYNVNGNDLSHAFSQFEMGVFLQAGRESARFQLHAGVILSGNGVETADGDTIIPSFTPGYRVDTDLSMPVVNQLRAFTSLGYQGYYRGDMPDYWNWRYGLRVTFGGNRTSELERVRLARMQAEQRAENEAMAANEAAIPATLPRQLSQSLPPIVTHSEVCKCFPAGPYTLQLGEFRTLEQAIRALEYRGLRQLFNSVPYERSPQVVFMAQPQDEGPVAFFLGEFDSLGATETWRRELRRHGLEGRVRRVVSSVGRIENRVRSVEDSLAPDAGYTEEQIARMNSLNQAQQSATDTVNPATASESMPLTANLVSPSLELETDPPAAATGRALLVGPLSESATQLMLGDPEFRRQWVTPDSSSSSTRVRLIWNAGSEQGWYMLDQFSSGASLDQARTWLDSRGLSATEQSQARAPSGDIYQYRLGYPPGSPWFSLSTEAQVASIWDQLLSPEMLWFQAFQAINDRPAEVILNATTEANRYQLIATGFGRRSEAEAAWRHLVSVGLQPGRVQ